MFNSFFKAIENLFKTPQTVDYPVTPIEKGEEYRGLIEYDEDSCIFCLKCEKVCPPGAILFVPTDNTCNNEKNKKGLKYYYNPHLCIYCGECVRDCPKPDEALWQSNKKPPIGLKEDMVNEKWFELERLKNEKKDVVCEIKPDKKEDET